MLLRMHVDNIMATMDAGCRLDLAHLGSLGKRKVKPSTFGGSITYRLKDQATSVQIHPSGKIVFTSNDLMGLYEARDLVSDDLSSLGIGTGSCSDLVINNIVASGDFKSKLDLVSLHQKLGMDKAEYEPEQFPGLVYHVDDPKATILLFSNGKIICTGATTPEQISEATNKVMSVLESS